MVCCPHCNRSIGGLNKAGEVRVKLAVVLCDPDTGRIHGPCPRCKGDVTLADGATMSKAVKNCKPVRLGLAVRGS